MIAVRAIFRIVIGILFGLSAAIAATPALAAFTTGQDATTPIIMLGLVLLSGVLCFLAPTIRRAFGRGFLLLGSAVFVLPVSALLLSGRAASDVLSSAEAGTEAAAVIGAGLAGAAVTGLATFVGVIIGTVLLLIGLILNLGGRREVIIVERERRREPTNEE